MPTVRDYLGTGQSGFESSISLDRPTSYQEGDLLVAFYAGRSGSSGNPSGVSLPSDWTLDEIVFNSGSGGCWTFVAYKWATGSEPSGYTFNFQSESCRGTGGIFVIAGADTSDWYISKETAKGGSGDISVDGFSISGDGQIVLGLFGAAHADNVSITTDVDFTEAWQEENAASGYTRSRSVGSYVEDEGDYDPITADLAGGNWVAWAFLLPANVPVEIETLTADDLTLSAPVLDSPALGQTHDVTVTDIVTGSPVIGTPAIGQVHELVVQGITGGDPVLGTPTVGEEAGLVAQDITAGSPVLDAPTIGQTHVLTASDITAGTPVLDTPTVGSFGTVLLVDTDGVSGDFSSLDDAVVSLPDPLTDNYVIEVAASTGVADTTPTTISIDLAGYDLTLRPTAGQAHDGVFDDALYYGEAEEFLVIQTSGNGRVIVDGLQFYQPTTTDRYRELITISQSSGDVVIRNCILTTESPHSDCSGIFATAPGGDVYLINDLIYGWDQNDNKGYWINSPGTDEYHYIYNCTFVDCYWAIRPEAIDEQYVIAKNTGVAGNWETSFGDASHPMTVIDCSDSDPEFIDSIQHDYHLELTDSLWKAQGGDLSTDPAYPVLFDFEGDARGSVYDIGADQSETIVSDDLAADDLLSGIPTLGEPRLGQVYDLTPDHVVSGNPVLESPAMGQEHALVSGDLLSSTPILGTPIIALEGRLVAVSIATGLPELGSPSIEQTHELLSTDTISGSPVLGAPGIGQTHSLTTSGIVTALPDLQSPTLSISTYALVSESILAGVPVIETPSFVQGHALFAVGIVTPSPDLGTAALDKGRTTLLSPIIVAGSGVAPPAMVSGSGTKRPTLVSTEGWRE